MSAEDAAILDEAANIIERNGWWQHFYHDPGSHLPMIDCAVCARGAINLAANRRAPNRPTKKSNNALSALERYLGISGQSPNSVADWNDEPDRTAEQVIAALRGAARAEREAAA